MCAECPPLPLMLTRTPFLMQYRVQRTRFNELERTRKRDLLLKMKADINLSKEMLSTMRSSITMPPVPSSRSLARSRPSRSQSPAVSAQC